MAKINKGDFVEIEYTGRIKDTEEIFDTTNKETAKKVGINSDMTHGPIVICIGQNQVLKGLDDEIEGNETEKDYVIELPPEKAFGKKNAKLFRIIPYSVFRKNKIEPQPGMQVNIDGMLGIIKTAASGRCMVDFNHPLSGKALIYEVKINRIVTDNKEKIKSFLELELNMRDAEVEIKENKADIILKKKIPKKADELLNKKLKQLIPDIREFAFTQKKK